MGYRISEGGYKPPPERVEAIVKYPKPENIKELRRFLGMFNFYRDLVPNAAELLRPLNAHLMDSRKNDKRKIKWTTESETAFVNTKTAIANIALTTFPDPNAPIIIRADVSDNCIGASLEQHVRRLWTPMSFYSKKGIVPMPGTSGHFCTDKTFRKPTRRQTVRNCNAP